MEDEEIRKLNIEIEKLKKINKELVDQTNIEITKQHQVINSLKQKINDEKLIITDYIKKHEIFKQNKKLLKEKKENIQLQDTENKLQSNLAL
jgi:hypothetical protein